ncbi:MAG: beta-ketoacyl-ACP synthase II [Candidatus Marinimicrobia bacterium]|jgi:3-oxoacyl-[acyl-carrier-protein] synthase II|nr:beta-ketoacyl-ACP synthase II [Candidatus Neomarinimicrobiota bacterium]MBT3633512.1 beta-ketoacyl-ACP synthase II [Candidatus Neomarinimicrobiota bacterium]MBT3681654.1 beta-ketoacyl-ACP synthase II [Candidatus Neomarinimicrobiota bacterium]MBT3758378.1 beta-ketoacyl-ACP synthase II [Candidatus Neomarinimicrobiota bacterium]MBT3894968.1 beta-ketoacyl-ACP synthase II [Candidatus Neomarinimicrobiota bacterium]
MDYSRRVVITGMGILSPLGNSISEFWDGISNGRNGIRPIEQFDTTDFAVHIAGEVRDLNFEDYIDRKELNRMDRFTAYALVTADQAITSAGITSDNVDHDRVGVIIGSGIGGIHTFTEQHSRLLKSPRRVSPFFIPAMITDIAAGQVSIKYGFKGPNYAVVSACATSSHVIGDAHRLIKYGDADIIIAGGSDATINPMSVAGFSNMKALTKNPDPETASRPFDLNRNGFVMGEGAALLVLEEYEHAKARGANIVAELSGYGATADAYHLTTPDPSGDGAIRSMKLAVKDAGLQLEDIDYINAHGTSTAYNDRTETKAIRTLFGDHAYKLSVSSTKSMTGHLLGAAGGIEAIATILALKNSLVPPTIHFETVDPDCDLDYTPNQARAKDLKAAISNTFGFGGHNATLLFKKWTE